jgi:hypothetical protein
MRICEYDEVDPLEVLHLNLLCLDFALTPELVAMIRRLDPRPFPCFALYAVEDDEIAGQVGLFRLPVVSAQGVEEVGGVGAIATHPAFSRREVVSRLFDEAHGRMRAASLRFSSVSIDGYRTPRLLYEKLGYESVFLGASLMARQAKLPVQTDLRAEQAGRDPLALADRLFEEMARNRLGFARRHAPFFPFLAQRAFLREQELWFLWKGSEAIGYAVASVSQTVLTFKNVLLYEGVDLLAAVAAVAREVPCRYVCLRVDYPLETSLSAHPEFWTAGRYRSAFLVKPLVKETTLDHFRQRFGVGTGHFLISHMDVTQTDKM